MYQHLVVTSRSNAQTPLTETVARYLYSGKVIGAATDLNRDITSVVVTNVPAQMTQSILDRLASGLYFGKAYDTLEEARVAAGLDDPAFQQERPNVACPGCGGTEISIVVQSWERTTFVEGVKHTVTVDSESLDFFASASCEACELGLSGNGGSLRNASLVNGDGVPVEDDAQLDAFVALVEHLYA